MRPNLPSVAAIVLTWNNFADTDECLRSAAALTYPNLKLMLVDNGSDDGSCARLKEAWAGRCLVIENAANLGVPGGYNAGLRVAIEQDAAYVLLLNNDVVVQPGLVEALLPAFDAVPRLGTVSPIISYYRDPNRVWFAGASYSETWGLTRHRHLGKKMPTVQDVTGRLVPTGYIPTCAALTATRVFRDVGLLDERFFIGHDDVDWALRLHARGWELRLLGKPLVTHKVSATVGREGSNVLTPAQAFRYGAGSMLMAAKHVKGWRLLPYMAGQLLVRWPFYSAQMAMAGSWSGAGAYGRGLADGYKRYLARRVLPP